MGTATDSLGKSKKRTENGRPIRNNPILRLLLCWSFPLFWYGYRRDLEMEDLEDTQKSDLSESLGDKLERNWLKEVERAKKGNKRPRLLRAIFKTFIWGYLFDGFLIFIQCMICKPFMPVCLALLLSQFASEEVNYDKAKYYTAGLVGLSFLNVIIQHHMMLRTQQRGMRIRIACCSIIYRKLLRLNSKSLNCTTAGQLVNIMSNDVNRFDNVLSYLHFLWIFPFHIALMCYLIYLEVNIAAIVGVITVTLQTVPVQIIMSKWTSKLRAKIAQRTDERVRLMSEIISGIQVIKMYAWEKPFEFIVTKARINELKAIKTSLYIRGIYMGFMVFTERASLYITLLTYSLLGNPISASTVFSLAQFYNKLQESLAYYCPNAMVMGSECLITIKRLEHFLTLEELESVEYNQSTLIRSKNQSVYSVELQNLNASWDRQTTTLSDLTIRIPKGKLCAIIGSVGSGKSSVLQLLLNELYIQSGDVKIDGELSYASQDPWLFVDTIRNNILFGEPYDKDRYKEVIEACALDKDLEQFPYYDRTLVGERGISLSGGQRARINLARAIYRKSDIYLLDDPLSAVDTHVGRHLFDTCIKAYLNDKTRILVTHQLHYLKAADVIIVMNNGKVENIGSYDELASSGQVFTKLLADLRDNTEDAPKTIDPMLVTAKKDYDDREGMADESEVSEESAKGKMRSSIYWKYWKASQNTCLVMFMFFAMVFGQFATTVFDFWVTFWSNEQNKISQIRGPSYEDLYYGTNITKPENFSLWDDIGPFNTVEYLSVYTVLIISCVTFIVARSFIFFLVCVKSSKGLHVQMFHNLLKTKMRFFDTNPSGRILNRFSKDIGAMDEVLPRTMIEMFQVGLVFLSIMVLVSVTNPWFLFPIVFISSVFYFLLNVYIGTARSIKRLESTTRSPVFSHMSASVNGVVTIRALHSQKRLAQEFDRRQDCHTSAWYNYIVTGNTLGFWLDIMCTVFLIIVCYSFIYFNTGNTVSGNIGLAISQTLILTGMLQFGVRQTTEVVAQMTSVERIMQYTELESEQDQNKEYLKVPENWPNNGEITFNDMFLYYNPKDQPVLKDLNIKIESGWKVGIVGRTGAGKSSLISALFRLTDIRGQIHISKIDTQFLLHHDIRSNISIIPQEPVLFCATLRYNLDPLDKYDDSALWSALEAVELKNGIHSLDYQITEGGGNLSLGQRQLVCLARAILRNNKILVLDEATANVDHQTDSFIQKTIRERFSHCTVLTIAHRLNTIMDSDRVMVMESGKVVEFDHPHLLLQNPDSYFTKMVKETGPKVSNNLTQIAKNAYEISNDNTEILNKGKFISYQF